MTADAPFIELDHATLTYQSRESSTHALNETSMTIAAGEFIGVIGPSGCGKSSLLKLISGLHPTTTGAVIVAGQKVTGPIKISGMAFQNATLLPWRTTLDNVLLPLQIVEPHASRFRSHRAQYEAMARDILGLVGLSGFEKKYPWELSGGMQQRSSLCRALIHEPRILLLDEPFGALDAFTREELWGVLQTLWLNRKPTVILVTHDLREAVYLSDTVYVMSARPGRIISKTKVSLPRPRTLRDTFKPEFIEMAQNLRTQISEGMDA
jgi:NitT/TauT family transport system ATP-binding protein